MNRWSKIVLGIGGLATAAWIAGGLLGPAAGRSPEALALHTLVVYGALLLWLLADVWTLVFLAGCARALRRAATAARRAEVAGRPRVFALGAAAVLLALAQFTLSGLLFPERMDPSVHFALALAALLAQLVFLTAGGRELARQHRLRLALETAP